MSDIITLNQQQAQATLLPGRGGLLHKLRLANAKADHEIFWSSDDFTSTGSAWPLAGCPIMFPFAGRVWNNGVLGRYQLADHEFAMDLHGFAYQHAWRVVQQTHDQCTLELRDSEATRRQFPFAFILMARYALTTPSTLAIDIAITHAGTCAPLPRTALMPVAMGLHPFFRVPIHADSDWQACTFSTAAATRIDVTADGNAAITRAPRPQPTEILTNTDLRSGILSDLRSPTCTLADPAGTSIELSWSPSSELVKNIVLWSNPEAGYFCMEPWLGLPDAPQRTETKKIAAGDTLRLHVTIHLLA